MADITGPISSLPGSRHSAPKGIKCDFCSDADAVTRIQGETDSFGCEMHDLCMKCAGEMIAYDRSPEARSGQCDWCKQQATDLRDARDYDEGMSGRVYRVCGTCIRNRDEEARAELEEYEYRYGYDGDFDDDGF